MCRVSGSLPTRHPGSAMAGGASTDGVDTMEDQAQKLRELMSVKPREAQQAKKTRVITVASGKGGVGKTNLSVNLAIAYARTGKRVMVMDADLGLANVNIMLNILPKIGRAHV